MQAEGGKLTERQAVQKVAQPCLTALADLHAKGVAHGAVLPDNVLFNSQEQSCKLAGRPIFCSSILSVQHARKTHFLWRNIATQCALQLSGAQLQTWMFCPAAEMFLPQANTPDRSAQLELVQKDTLEQLAIPMQTLELSNTQLSLCSPVLNQLIRQHMMQRYNIYSKSYCGVCTSPDFCQPHPYDSMQVSLSMMSLSALQQLQPCSVLQRQGAASLDSLPGTCPRTCNSFALCLIFCGRCRFVSG